MAVAGLVEKVCGEKWGQTYFFRINQFDPHIVFLHNGCPQVRCGFISYGTVKKMVRKFSGNSVLRLGLLLVLTLFSAVSGAQGLASADLQLVGERPNASGPPTEVTLGIYLFDVDYIDDASQQFSVDMFAAISWQDPRWALPENERADQTRTVSMDQIWIPRGLIANDRGLSNQLPRSASIDDLGNVVLRQRLTGRLAVAMQLQKFPFDKQRLPITVLSYQYSPDEVRFSVNTDVAGDAGSFSAAGWRLRILEPEYGEFTVPALGIVRPQLTYIIEAERASLYYMMTMFLPMSLIVLMAWSVFWIQPDIVPARIGLSTASIFSLLALGFSIRLSLPAVSYMTRADAFVIGCTLLVFVALGTAVVGSRWASSDRLEKALRLNAVARWVYLGLFAVVATFSLTM